MALSSPVHALGGTEGIREFNGRKDALELQDLLEHTFCLLAGDRLRVDVGQELDRRLERLVQEQVEGVCFLRRSITGGVHCVGGCVGSCVGGWIDGCVEVCEVGFGERHAPHPCIGV